MSPVVIVHNAAKHMSTEVDYAIVGSGVIGVCCALLLAQRTNKKIALIGGIQIIEQAQRTYALNRVSQRLLTQARIWQLLDPVPYTSMNVQDIETAARLIYTAADYQENNLGHMVTDRDLAIAMKALVENHSMILYHPTQLQSLERQDSTSRLLLEDGTHITSRLVIAADGKASKVASLCNVPVKHRDTGDVSIVSHLRLGRDHQYCAHQWLSHEGIIAFLPLKDRHEASLVWSVHTKVASQLMRKTQEELGRHLTQGSLRQLGDIHMARPAVSFPISQHNLQSYYLAGIVFVGDSAHSIHPLAGQGMNMGLQDVLELVLQLTAPEHQLSSETAALFRFQQNRQIDNYKHLGLMQTVQTTFRSTNSIIQIGRSLVTQAFQSNKLLQKRTIEIALYGGLKPQALEEAIQKLQTH